MAEDNLSDEDKELFRKAMQSVKPLRQSNKKISTYKKPAPVPSRPQAPFTRAEPTVFLSDSYREELPSDAVLSWTAHPIPAKRMRELKSGLISIQGRLDLHGKSPDAAREALIEFIRRQTQSGHRGLLIIHGKGGLRGEKPILKNLVNYWLPQLPTVLAFHSALAKDGGHGAVYVLLKKMSKSQN
ncbi:DNA mismatch repair protein-like protein [Legionella birminghamensis]|uniref:DNA mismatch repair protein-like protein n=1 Tax=Legionella birminghamensis TaxID=28083 RepID=A0A378ID66_9GAMM|nr:Smr/MutS family protein [Legionella birminghamensis]KTC71670.1 DNA mismatch repair protein-like protein [Legionella birminghamensis]STX32491.1 Smr domain protein, DNA mismatch repair protein-like protein [Legionella birminghamensis]